MKGIMLVVNCFRDFVSSVYMVVQAVIVAVYLAMPRMHYACLGGSVAVLGIGYVLFMRKYFKLHLAVK